MNISRRTFAGAAACFAAGAILPRGAAGQDAAGGTAPAQGTPQATAPVTRTIPSTGEAIPVIGMGTWLTFDVGDDDALRAQRTEVMRAFFNDGGRLIDSSPMYRTSQPMIGYGLERLGQPQGLFSAEKVWTSDASQGAAQVGRSRRFWGVPRFDLVQIHNFVAWEEHLPVLFEMKAAGDIRYVGITTAWERDHDLMEQIMRAHPIDFVQLTYNPVDHDAERRLLPLAAERGIAVSVNRPFQQGVLTQRLARETLPDWAGEVGAQSWAQFILKYVVSHPAVTVVIPATTRVDHVRENVAAGSGVFPDAAMRERMANHIRSL